MKQSASAKKKLAGKFVTYGIVIAFYIIIQALNGAGMVSPSIAGQLVPICAYVTMAVSLNLVVGFSGELSLGHAGFMSVGAFSGIVASMSLQQAIPNGIARLAVAMLVGAVCAGIAGVIVGVPVLRLQGDYLAIVTLAFGEIIKNIFNILYVGVDAEGLHFSITNEADLHLGEGGVSILQGPMGATANVKLSTFTVGTVLVLIALFVVLNLVHSRAGRAIMAMRDNRIAAESVGISVTKYKMIAFVTSAALAGAAGTLYGCSQVTVTATKFDFNTSILILVFVVLGGLGNIRGSMIAAIILTMLPELLRGLNDYRMLIYAVVLIVMMIFNSSPKAIEMRSVFLDRIKKNKKSAKEAA